MKFKFQESLLIFITILWGATFLITRIGVSEGGPFWFLLLRFGSGVAILAALSLADWRNFTRDEIKRGILLGSVLFLSSSLQTVGLRMVNSSKSAFITSLYVPIVPILQWLWLGYRPRVAACVGIALAGVGLALLSIQSEMSFTFDLGERLTLGCEGAIALEILLIGRWSSGLDPRRWAFCQMSTVVALSWVAIGLAREATPFFSNRLLSCAIGLGIATSAIQVGMNWAEKSVSPTRATLIYALEPVWAGLIGALAGEALTGLNTLGAGLNILGVLSDALWPDDVKADELSSLRTASRGCPFAVWSRDDADRKISFGPEFHHLEKIKKLYPIMNTKQIKISIVPINPKQNQLLFTSLIYKVEAINFKNRPIIRVINDEHGYIGLRSVPVIRKVRSGGQRSDGSNGL